MKKSLTSLILLSASLLSLAGCGDPTGSQGGGGGNTPTGPVKTIVVDGGGDISNFQSTPTMIQSEANPYPYNTLEKLCKEWEALNPGYTVKINKTSAGGDRSVLTSQLQTKTAADIIYQNGTVVNSDLGKGWYVDLTPYLEAPSKYLDGKPWKSVYDEGELASTQAADGKYYYCSLEKIPVAFMYNKTITSAAGVDASKIQTFSQLLKAMEAVDAYYKKEGKIDGSWATYTTTYTWYQIAMESNMFGDLVELGDVLRTNKMVDTEELCRLYQKGLYNPSAGVDTKNPDASTFENNRLYDYVSLINKLDQYKAPATYAANNGWSLGKVAFLEATGAQLRTFAAFDTEFEWGTICFPDITKDDHPSAQKGVVRGSAGLATSWWVSNSAVEKGTTEACIDLLQFLTAPAQNNRLIGDLKGGLPLNPTADYKLEDYLVPLHQQYVEDIKEAKEGNRVLWGSFNSWAVLGNNYSNSFIRTMQEMDAGTTTKEQAVVTLAKLIKSTVASYMIEYEYDTSLW